MSPDTTIAIPLGIGIALQAINIRAVFTDGVTEGVRPYNNLWAGIAALLFTVPSFFAVGLYISASVLIIVAMTNFTYAALIYIYSPRFKYGLFRKARLTHIK